MYSYSWSAIIHNIDKKSGRCYDYYRFEITIVEEKGVFAMNITMLIIALAGIAVDIWFIGTEYAGKMLKATVLKGCASLFFVLLGIYCYTLNPSPFGKLILIGLILGLIGDVFLNLRNLYEGGKSNKVFAVGILAFLSGHFLYIAALIKRFPGIVLMALVITAVISVLAIPPLMKQISAPSKGLKIFGYVYLVIVIAMFSAALSLLIKTGAGSMNIVFTVGAFLFLISDFIMIYYSFGKKIKPLRAINLLSYYVGQLLIALCIFLA